MYNICEKLLKDPEGLNFTTVTSQPLHRNYDDGRWKCLESHTSQ